MANQNILSIDRGSAKATEKYLSDLIKQINVLNDRVNSVSLTNVIDPRQVDTMKKSLTNVVKQVEVIVTKHQEGVAQVTKQTAKGMNDVMSSAIDTQAIKEASALLAKLKSDVASASKGSATGAGGASKEVLDLADSVDVLQKQLDTYQTSTAELTKSLSNVNDIYSQMSQTSGQLVESYSDMAAYADDMSFATRSASKDYGRLATQAERGASSFQDSANSMSSFVGDIQVANDQWSDVYATAGDVKDVVEGTDFSNFQAPAEGLGNVADGLNEAANSISDLVSGSSDLSDSFGSASDQIDGAALNSKEMQKLWTMIAASVEPLPEMLKAMKVLVSQAGNYARQTGLAALSTDQMADTWQNTVLNAVAMQEATGKTADAMKRVFGPEIVGSVTKMESSTKFISSYIQNIYDNMTLAEQINSTMGYEAVSASSGSAAIMEHVDITKHLLIDQASMIGKARVLQVMAKQAMKKNQEDINDIDTQYNALSKKIQGAGKGREWMSLTEKDQLKTQQAQLTAQRKSLEIEMKRKQADTQLLGVFNKITGIVQGGAAALGVGVEANQKRLELANKLVWAEKAMSERAWNVKEATDGFSESMQGVELTAKRIDQFTSGIEANFRGGMGIMQDILEGGLAGSIKQVTLIKTAQNMMKQSDGSNKYRLQEFIRQQRGKGAQAELDKIARERRGLDQAIMDSNKGLLQLSASELNNIKYRQKMLDAKSKTLQREVAIGKGATASLGDRLGGNIRDGLDKAFSPVAKLFGMNGYLGKADQGGSLLDKAAFRVTDVMERASDFFTRSDKNGEKRRNIQQQILTMEEQSERLSKESAKNNRSLADAIAGSYKQQRTAIAASEAKPAEAQDVYKSIETTSAKILEQWQKIFEMFMKMNSLNANGGMSVVGDSKEIANQADGIEALAEKIDASSVKFKSLFNPALVQRWGSTLGKEFNSIEDLIADPEAFKLYEEDIIQMLSRTVQNTTDMSKEAAENLARQMIPSLQKVQDAAAGKGSIQNQGYFFDDMENQFKKKTQTINRLMKTQTETGFQAVLKNGIMNPDQMADAIFRNADRLADMFSEDYFAALKTSLPGHEQDGAKTLSDFMSDPELWGDARHSIISTLAQQFAALNGESAEFNYALAHELLPTIDEVKRSVATGEPIKMDLKIDDIKLENAQELHEQLVNKIMKTSASPGENALLMSNKGLEGREYMVDDIKNLKSSGLRGIQQKIDAARGKQDLSVFKSRMSFLSGELAKITEEYNNQIELKAGDAALKPLLEQEATVKQAIAETRKHMDDIVNDVNKVDKSSMTTVQRIAYETRTALGQTASGMVGALATIQEHFSIGDAAKSVSALGRETTQLASLQAAYEIAQQKSDNVMSFRYQALIDARKSLDETTNNAGAVDSGAFEEFLNKIRAIPQESAQAIKQVGEQAYSQLSMIEQAMSETTDPNKIAMLQDIADQQRQSIDDYKQMIQTKSGFDSGTAAKWQNRVGQASQIIQSPNQMKSGLMQTNFSDVLGNNFDDIQSKLLEFGSKLKGFGGIFKFLAGNLGRVMAVLQGVNIGFDVFDRIMGKSPEQIAKYAEAIDRIGENISNMLSSASGASATTANDQINQLKMQQLNAQIQYNMMGDAAMKMTGMGDMIKSGLEKAIVGTTTLYGTMGEKAMEANKSLSEINKTLRQAIAAAPFINQIASMNRVVDRAQQAFQDLMDIEGQKVQAEFEFNKEKRADQAEFDRQFKRDSEQKAMDLLYSQEDWAKQRVDAYKENMQAILDIEKDYTKSIKDADKDMNEARKESFKQLTKESAQGDLDYQKSKKDAETNYQDQSYESEKDYIKGMIQTQKDYAKERMRQERDLIDQLRDLEMSNDVLGYIQAKRDADKQMKDSDDDHNAQLADTKKQHAEERAANQKAHELEMADLDEQNADRILQLTVGYLEEQQQRMDEHNKQLTQMKLDADERLNEQIKNYAKSEAEAWNQYSIDEEREKARTAMAKRYAEEDRAMQLAANDKAYQDQLVQFQEQETVSRNNLIEYYKAQNMTQAEAEDKADAQIKTYHDSALTNLTTHGMNMSNQAFTNNQMMLDKEVELGNARVTLTAHFAEEMAYAIQAVGMQQIDNANKAAVESQSGSLFDIVGNSLSKMAADAVALGVTGIGALLGQETDFYGTAKGVYGKLRNGAKTDTAADGGSFKGGEVILVGEKGPELFVPGQAGTIIPNDISEKIAAQGGVVKGFAEGTSNVKNAIFRPGSSDPSGGRGFVPPDTTSTIPLPNGRGGKGVSNDPSKGRGFVPPGGGYDPGGTSSGGSGTPVSMGGAPSNTAPVIWSGGKPTAGNNRQGSTSVEVMPDSPALVVSDMHYKPGVDSVGGAAPKDGTDWESELNKLGPGRDKLADTKKRIDEIQTKFQANWLKIASTNTDYQSKVGSFDKDRLNDLYKNTFETYSKDLLTRREFADKMVMEGKTYNKDAWQNQTTFNQDVVSEQQKNAAIQLENYKGLFTGMVNSLTGGKADSIAIIDGLTQGATDLLNLFNVDGTGAVKNFVDNAGGFLKNLFGASDKSDEAGKKTESGMGSIFNTISSFVQDVPGTTKDLMSAGLAVLQGKAPDFATAFKATHDEAGKGIQKSDAELMKNRQDLATNTASAVYTVEQKQLASTQQNIFDMSDIIGKGQSQQVTTQKNALDVQNKNTKNAMDQTTNTVKNATNTIVDVTSKGFAGVQGGAIATGTGLVNLQNGMLSFVGNLGSMVTSIVALSAQIVSAKNSASSYSSGSHSSSSSHSSTGGTKPSDLETRHTPGGGRAGGGGVDSSHGYMVGERGPEWFQPDKVGRITTTRDLKSLMGIIPKAYDAMMTDIRTPRPDYSSHHGTNLSLRIDNLTIGSDMSRMEIEQQFKRMQMTIVRSINTAVS